MKSIEELKERLKTYKGTQIKVEATAINYNPHPYTLGPKHIKHASENCSGMLGDATIKVIPCAHPKCKLSYDEHKFDTVLAITLKRDLKESQVQNALKYLVKGIFKEGDFDGFIFIKSEFNVFPNKLTIKPMLGLLNRHTKPIGHSKMIRALLIEDNKFYLVEWVPTSEDDSILGNITIIEEGKKKGRVYHAYKNDNSDFTYYTIPGVL